MEYTRRINTRSKSLKLTLSSTGEIIVTTPRFIPEFAVKKFVRDHQDWINQRLAELDMKRQELLPGKTDQILFFGVAFTVENRIDHQKPIGISVDNENKILKINPVSATKQSVQRALKRFFTTQIEEYILQKANQLSKKMNIQVHNISFKRQSTRWGSCSSTGNLNFNMQLIHAPQHVIDYVIVHELAHRTHMDHSKKFWQLVEHFDPEYRKHRGWLKRHGMILQSQDILQS